MTLNLAFSFRPGQKYYTYPGRKYVAEVNGPEYFLNYRGGFGDVNYHLISLAIEEDNLPLGAWGYSAFRVQGGSFVQRKSLEFMDFMHFNGNQTILGDQERYMNSFLLLPYYEYSTDRAFFQAHWQHHFEGAILDWIPLINKLGCKLVLGDHFLQVDQKKSHYELTAGIDKVGFGAILMVHCAIAPFRQPAGDGESCGRSFGPRRPRRPGCCGGSRRGCRRSTGRCPAPGR